MSALALDARDGLIALWDIPPAVVLPRPADAQARASRRVSVVRRDAAGRGRLEAAGRRTDSSGAARVSGARAGSESAWPWEALAALSEAASTPRGAALMAAVVAAASIHGVLGLSRESAARRDPPGRRCAAGHFRPVEAARPDLDLPGPERFASSLDRVLAGPLSRPVQPRAPASPAPGTGEIRPAADAPEPEGISLRDALSGRGRSVAMRPARGRDRAARSMAGGRGRGSVRIELAAVRGSALAGGPGLSGGIMRPFSLGALKPRPGSGGD